MNVSAIPIDLVPDESTQAFIPALICFGNIHGTPSQIHSNYARSFNVTLGGHVIKHHIGSTEFCNSNTNSVTEHIKIPLYSSWIGSTWERLIRDIKSCLFKTLGRAKVNYFYLSILLSDIKKANSWLIDLSQILISFFWHLTASFVQMKTVSFLSNLTQTIWLRQNRSLGQSLWVPWKIEWNFWQNSWTCGTSNICSRSELFWDLEIQTVHRISVRRPDLVRVKKKNLQNSRLCLRAKPQSKIKRKQKER